MYVTSSDPKNPALIFRQLFLPFALYDIPNVVTHSFGREHRSHTDLLFMHFLCKALPIRRKLQIWDICVSLVSAKIRSNTSLRSHF